MMSRFPKVTETFILYEILSLQQLGLAIEIFPLIHERESVAHAEVDSLADHIHYYSVLSLPVLAAQLYWLRRSPSAYLKTWWHVLTGSARSPKFLSRALVTMPMAALFARRFQALGIEHVHAHWATHPALAAYVVHRLTKLPYSVTAHAHDIYVDRTMLEEKLRQAEFVVTISQFNRHFLEDLYGDMTNLHVVTCGINVDLFQPRQEQKQAQLFTLVCVASLEERKGHRFLLEALAQLRKEALTFQCLLVGDGEQRQAIETQVAALGLQNTVKLLGRQPQHRVRELLAQADLMVLPSIVMPNGKMEGIPVGLMEALAMQLPVIATSTSGIPELVDNDQTGLLVPERDSPTLAAAIRRLYHDPVLRKTLGVNGRNKVTQEYNLHTNAQQLYALFTATEPRIDMPEEIRTAV